MACLADARSNPPSLESHFVLGTMLLACLASAAADEDPFAAIRTDQADKVAALEEEPPRGLEIITRNLRPSFELFERLQVDGETAYLSGGVGAEFFTQIVTHRGTWGTADVQLRLLCQQPDRCGAFEVHNAYLERRLFFGRLNLRAGHFQVPFNLEALPLDTHTPIIQLSNRQLLGLKHDWGLQAGGQLERLDYALSWTVGSGMAWPSISGAGLFAGRVGFSTPTELVGVGLSGALRDVPDEEAGAPRAGTDLSLALGPVDLAAEGSLSLLGEPAVLVRAELEPPSRRVSAILQYSRIDSIHAAWLHRAELEAALRLLPVTPGSFLRLNLAREQDALDAWWRFQAQIYLLFGG